MLSSFQQPLVMIFALAFAFLSPPMKRTTPAQEFRIESEVYLGDEKTPVSQNLTLFSDNMIYDFQMSDEAQPKPLEIVIFDRRDEYFILIDMERNVRMRLSLGELVQMLEGLRRQTLQSETTKFLLTEKFTEEFDMASEWCDLKSKSIEYRFRGKQPSDVSVLPVFYDFLDQFTNLKASDPTKLPPFARARLNQAIKKLGWFPSTVEVKLNKNELFAREISMCSKHTLISSLSEKDHQRIKDAKSAWMRSKKVDFREYRKLPKRGMFTTTSRNQSVAKAVNPPVNSDKGN